MMQIDIATAPGSWGVLMKATPNVPPDTQVLDGIKAAGTMGLNLAHMAICLLTFPNCVISCYNAN